MESKDLLALLQICDTAFPIGGFSHSLGLEACIQHNNGRKIDQSDLYSTFVCILENTGSFGIPLVKACHAADGSSQVLREADEFCEACSSNHVAKRASTKQGTSLLEIACTVFEDIPGNYRASLNDLPHCHFPVVFGAITGGLGFSLDVAETAFMFSAARTVIATAVRLDVIGAMEGQKIQLKLQNLIPDILHRNKDRTMDKLCIKFPLIDIIQNTQDTFFYKLFCS